MGVNVALLLSIRLTICLNGSLVTIPMTDRDCSASVI